MYGEHQVRYSPEDQVVLTLMPRRNMTRDPEVFPNPDIFDPERYMEKVDDETAHKRDPRNVIFGFGRR